jgi:hypothetical protein
MLSASLIRCYLTLIRYYRRNPLWHKRWFANHADKLRGGSKLKTPEAATTVRLDRGEPVIPDGPFVEGKEVVSGYVGHRPALPAEPNTHGSVSRAQIVRKTFGAQH